MIGDGTEKALRQLFNEEAPTVRAMVRGEIPAGPLYIARALDDLHNLKATADKLRLQALREKVEESWSAA